MNDQAPSATELLQRRLTLVGDVSTLNAQALKLLQALAGAEMEVLRLELEIGRTAASAQLVRDLHEAEKNAAAIRAAQTECDDRIADADREVAELDLQLATARRT
ncbi:hypothetical protein ASC75_09030 [Aminobacter sp. DSM 101952]|uniref:hypothetical protein n=1 Tax=Aminobacter sp. DSM 101952 TaxID=2735891 RepID=UPI00070060B6|nr:hypothetical protein [Aminobacter sp. DSM 101952]KQU66753.1 hypothetical protein ASC75_09030 [Aminobacter sp. DSM 101952]